MPKQLTFIHAADLHLGAPFRGLRAVSDDWANRLFSAISEAYDRVIDAAITRKVDFVVIAGDVFDLTRASYGEYLHFFEGLNRLDSAGIPSFLITGNHDPYTSWTKSFFSLPPSAIMLPADRPGFELVQRDGEPLCIIGGRGYYNQTWPDDKDIAEGITRTAAEQELCVRYPRVAEAPFAVGLLHTGLNLDHTKAPVDPHELLCAGMDYWALGHIHMKYVYPSLENPRMAFSGCIQGRDIKETGERGVFQVTLTEGAPNELEFIPTASVVWQRLKVDVSDCDTLPAITDKIMRELFRENGQAHCEQMVTRITLEGTTELHAILARPDVLEDMRKSLNDSYSEFFCDALLDATVAPRDKEALEREGLFPAVFLQISQAQQENPEGAISYVQSAFLNKNIPMPSSCLNHLDVLSQEAENYVLDLLSSGAEQ